MEDLSFNNVCDPVLLTTFLIKKRRCRVYLNRGVLIWESEEGTSYSQFTLPLSNVIGVEYEHPSELSAYTNELMEVGEVPEQYTSFKLHYVVRGEKNKLQPRKVTMTHTEPQQVASWVKAIRNFISELTYRPKRLLLFVNPFGGKKKGQKIYEKIVKPLLARAGVETEVVVTQRQSHAYETVLNHSLEGVDGIACIGGDGTLAEVFNALVLRAAKENNVDPNDAEAELPQSAVRVGVIPGGSTDTVAYCLHGTTHVQTAALHIILGESTGLDLCSVHDDSGLLHYYASMFSYGYLGDVCKSSEKFRWMGPKRYDYSGVRKFLANRGYLSEVTLLTNRSDSAVVGPKCYRNCTRCQLDQSNCKPTNEGDWHTVRGRFFMVSGTNVSCACDRSPNGFSPYCHIGDGCLDVILIKHTNLINNLRLLLRLSSKTKNMFDLPFVEVHRAREFTFQATPDQKLALLDPDAPDARTSVWNCDGEVVRGTNIKIRAHRQLVRVFSQRMEEEQVQRTSCLSCK